MRRSRYAAALAGLVPSLLMSVAAWYYFGTLLLFLFVPLVPILLRGRGADSEGAPDIRTCPVCGFEPLDDRFEFCPIDGNRLD